MHPYTDMHAASEEALDCLDVACWWEVQWAYGLAKVKGEILYRLHIIPSQTYNILPLLSWKRTNQIHPYSFSLQMYHNNILLIEYLITISYLTIQLSHVNIIVSLDHFGDSLPFIKWHICDVFGLKS